MAARFIDPTTDFGFKRLFGQEDSKPVLRAFLDAVLELSQPISELSFIPAEQSGDSAASEIDDAHCQDAEGQRFIVRVQRGEQAHFRDRSVYAMLLPVMQQVQRGDIPYPSPQMLLPIYTVAVLNFTLDDDPRHLRRIQLCDMATGQPFYQGLTSVYIELPKFRGTLSDELSLADKWVWLLRHLPTLTDIPAELDHAPFLEAFARAER